MSFKFNDHTAFGDIEIEIEAKNVTELFLDVAYAFVETSVHSSELKDSIIETITLKNQSLEELLFDWIEALIILKDSKGFIPKKIDIEIEKIKNKKNNGNKQNNDSKKDCFLNLKSCLKGDILDFKIHNLRHDVKAPTYHDFSLKENNGKFIAKIVLDL